MLAKLEHLYQETLHIQSSFYLIIIDKVRWYSQSGLLPEVTEGVRDRDTYTVKKESLVGDILSWDRKISNLFSSVRYFFRPSIIGNVLGTRQHGT